MKRIFNIPALILIVLTAVTLSSCKKEERALDLNLTPVGALATPVDNVNIKLEPSSSANVLFKWEPVSTTDGGLILYEIAFDKENGDLSNPLFKMVSAASGTQPQANLSHKDLNKIANMAGIAASSAGKLKWTVIASKGANALMSSVFRQISVERPAGFAENPEQLYLTGSATEGGSDLSKAVKLKRIDDGVFEVYTSLKAGNYILTDKNSAGGKQYYLDNGMLQEGSTPITVTGPGKTYRMNFDFTSRVSSSMEIQSVGLYISAHGKEMATLNYIGNGVFQAPRIPIEFYQFSWGRDERYKFVLNTSAGKEYMGSSSKDNSSPAGKPASYFYLQPVSSEQWDFTYKFDPSADRKDVKIDVMFQPDAYAHKVTVL